jgi:hypothetical protein
MERSPAGLLNTISSLSLNSISGFSAVMVYNLSMTLNLAEGIKLSNYHRCSFISCTLGYEDLVVGRQSFSGRSG